MNKNRLEAFTDGVMAIIVTIMVLELDLPKSNELADILDFIQGIWIYAISFVYVAIYWMNHHHLLYTVKKINGKIMLVNNLLLFFISLIPIATKGLSLEMTSISVFFYGLILNLAGISYMILIKTIISEENYVSRKIYEHEGTKKEVIRVISYIIALFMAFISPVGSIVIYILVSIMWVIPDRRIEDNIECAKLNYDK